MKLILLFLTFFFVCNQPKNPCDMVFEEMRVQAKEIMKELQISMRTSVSKDDGEIYVKANPTYLRTRSQFRNDKAYDSVYPSLIHYRNPRIECSQQMYNYLNKTEEAGNKLANRNCILANAIIIHELTHYYQADSLGFLGLEYIDDNGQNTCEYLLQQPEFESFAVMSFYVMSIMDKDALSKLLRQFQGRHSRCVALIRWFIANGPSKKFIICDSLLR